MMTPRTAKQLETWLVSRLAAVRDVDPQSIDVRERFSRYGLDSLGAGRLIAESRRTGGAAALADAGLGGSPPSRPSPGIVSGDRRPSAAAAERAGRSTTLASPSPSSAWRVASPEPDIQTHSGGCSATACDAIGEVPADRGWDAAPDGPRGRSRRARQGPARRVPRPHRRVRPALLRHLPAGGGRRWTPSSGSCSSSRWEALEDARHPAALAPGQPDRRLRRRHLVGLRQPALPRRARGARPVHGHRVPPQHHRQPRLVPASG